MANNEFTKPGGVWPPMQSIPMGLLADLDAKTVRSVSGTGGAYYLDDDMVWTGDPSVLFDVGVETIFRADVTLENDTFITGPSYHYGTSGFYAASEFQADASFQQNASFYDQVYVAPGAEFFCYGTTGFYNHVFFEAGSDPIFNAPTEFNYQATFGSGVVINGPLITNNVVILGDATHVTQLRGPTTLNDKMTMTGTGSIAQRALAGDNVTVSYSPLAVHEVVMESGVLSGSTDWTIDDTGCTDGNEILFGNKDAANAIDVRRPGGALIISLNNEWVRCVRIAGVWQKTQQGAYS